MAARLTGWQRKQAPLSASTCPQKSQVGIGLSGARLAPAYALRVHVHDFCPADRQRQPKQCVRDCYVVAAVCSVTIRNRGTSGLGDVMEQLPERNVMD
jgi:hypothetical protein